VWGTRWGKKNWVLNVQEREKDRPTGNVSAKNKDTTFIVAGGRPFYLGERGKNPPPPQKKKKGTRKPRLIWQKGPGGGKRVFTLGLIRHRRPIRRKTGETKPRGRGRGRDSFQWRDTEGVGEEGQTTSGQRKKKKGGLGYKSNRGTEKRPCNISGRGWTARMLGLKVPENRKKKKSSEYPRWLGSAKVLSNLG